VPQQEELGVSESSDGGKQPVADSLTPPFHELNPAVLVNRAGTCDQDGNSTEAKPASGKNPFTRMDPVRGRKKISAAKQTSHTRDLATGKHSMDRRPNKNHGAS
jgi:hypothetical protein